MRKLLLIIATALFTYGAYAQQEPMHSQYMFNQVVINPAYAGTHSFAQATASYRNQWTGFEGAPKTSVLAIEGPVKQERMGLGLIVGNDRIGVTNQTDVYANYAYKLPLGKNTLSFGLKGGISHYTARLADLKVWDLEDRMYMQARNSALVPKFGFGTYFYSDNYFAGLSIPTLVTANERRNAEEIAAEPLSRKHYYLHAGYVHTLSERVKVKPSFLLKYVKAAPVQADISLNTLLFNTVWLGATYRTGAAIVALAEYQVSPKLRVGYAYDFSTTMMRNYSNGSHEIRLGWDLKRDPDVKVKTPRFF